MRKFIIAGLLAASIVPQIASAHGYPGNYGYGGYGHGGGYRPNYGYRHNAFPYVAAGVGLGLIAGGLYYHNYDRPVVVERYPAPVYVAPPAYSYGPQPYTCTYYPDGSRYCN